MIKPIDRDADSGEFAGELAEEEFTVEEEVTLEAGPFPQAAEFCRQCEEFFSPGGSLHNAAKAGNLPYEFRPQQMQMAKAIAEALTQGENLCIEAPTGVGKSFAYLIPLIFRAKLRGRPAVVSTETINLQEQLMQKDIPFLNKICQSEFKAALAKGRHNYLCRRRFGMVTGEIRDILLPSPSMVLDLDRLERWSENTDTGDRDSLEFKIEPGVWSLVGCEAGNCLGPKCGHFRNCFYFRARREWETADIIIANHALFFTDLGMKSSTLSDGGGLLPNYGMVLIDEAHTLEDNAAEHLGLSISKAGVLGFLNRLFNPENAKGILLRRGEKAINLRALVSECQGEVYGFFADFDQYLEEHKETAKTIRDCGRFADNLSPKLIKLAKELAIYAEDESDESFQTEIEAQLGRCREYINGIDQFLKMAVPDAVYFAEKDRNNLSLKAAPLNVAQILGDLLFNQDYPVMLCSATLTVRNTFDYFLGRTGFTNGKTLQLDSPFHYTQAEVLISQSMPDPSDAGYLDALAREIPRYIEMTHGKAFVLFTSYQTLRYCADKLRDYFEDNRIQLLIQGEKYSRSHLLKEFKEDINSVLFGTDSFWTGVDVPGEALSNVIITKLPFAVPSHPLIAARMARIEERGKSSFMEYSLPEAVLKFRQGAGRLIRSRHDRGFIVLLDRRVISKHYGRLFLDSIPYSQRVVK